MAINRAILEALLGQDARTSAMLDAIEPYLPVLGRMGKAGLDAFLDAVRQQDWQRVDRALYERMTEQERDALSAKVLKDAREAVKGAYETNRLWQEDLLRVAFGLLLSAI